jgi:uncharacterized membrane protein YfcA
VVAAAVVAVASAVQGAVGFGAALLAAPALLLLHPAFAPGPILVSNLVLTLLVVRREWAFVDFRDLRFLAGGRAAGTVVAAGVLASLSQVLFDLLFGTLVLIAVGLSLLRGGFPRSGRNLTLAGFASGLMGTLSSIGGPPVALIYQGVDPPRFRATLGVLLVLGATLSIAATWAVGRFGDTEVILSAVIVPAAFVGFWLSRFGIHWASGPRVRVAVLVLSTSAALGVLARTVAGAS